jgi:hypothetical protein
VHVHAAPARPPWTLASTPREQSLDHEIAIDEDEATHRPRVARPSTANAKPLGNAPRAR